MHRASTHASPKRVLCQQTSQKRGILTINLISPCIISSHSPDFVLTVKGSGYSPNSVVCWNQKPLTTSYVTDRKLTAKIPVTLIKSYEEERVLEKEKKLMITVLEEGDKSNPCALVVTPSPEETLSQNLSFPQLSAISPSMGGKSQFVLNVYGSGFTAQTKICWNGEALMTTYVSPVQAVAVVSELLIRVGDNVVSVSSGGNSLNFVCSSGPISGVTPKLTSLSPGAVPVGSPSFILVLTGQNFTTRSKIILELGSSEQMILPTTQISSTQLRAIVDQQLVTSRQTLVVKVLDQGLSSNSLKLIVF